MTIMITIMIAMTIDNYDNNYNHDTYEKHCEHTYYN